MEGILPDPSEDIAEDVERSRKQHPGAEVLVHPECRTEVTEIADKFCLTEG